MSEKKIQGFNLSWGTTEDFIALMTSFLREVSNTEKKPKAGDKAIKFIFVGLDPTELEILKRIVKDQEAKG